MIQATLIAAVIVSLWASWVTWRNRKNGCTEQQTSFRVVAALVWLSLSCMYAVALLDPHIYLIRSGIITRASQITIAFLYSGDILLGRRQ